ncbi:thioredoxin family protein [Microbacterium sp. RD1]|uniref:thioredoxin family protein n=1 Tax=Microbacterium sp. RD1 TaxID=3457313 RepID=UPI003FA595FE
MTQELSLTFELYSTSFCGACRQTRGVLDRAAQLVSGVHVTEHDVAFEPDLAESLDIRATPTVIIRRSNGEQVLRAEGVPSIDQVLVATAKALDAP